MSQTKPKTPASDKQEKRKTQTLMRDSQQPPSPNKVRAKKVTMKEDEKKPEPIVYNF